MEKLKKANGRRLYAAVAASSLLFAGNLPSIAAQKQNESTTFESTSSTFGAQPTSKGTSNQPSLWDATHPSAIADATLPKGESGANQERIPKQILKTGVNLESADLSANSRQLADQLQLAPLLRRIQELKKRIDPTNFEITQENLALSQQLTASTVMAMQILDETNLSIDFVMAEISAEQNIYTELLGTFSSDRDKKVFKTNAASFITNGILWALAEAYDIPTNHHPNFSTASGTLGILAGLVPSVASGIALYQLNGKKETSEKDPNMLSRLLGYPATSDIDYPKPVWDFLNTVPAIGGSTKSRKEQLVDRWISDKNIPNFTDRSSKEQLDIMTASAPRKKGLSISTLNARQQLLQQLSAEVLKMKRMLYELSMAVRGAKQL